MTTGMEQAKTEPVCKKSRFRLSLRGLMVLVLIIGGGLGWIVYRARVQREAIAVIRRAGGDVNVNLDWTSNPAPRLRLKPPGPAWMRKHLGPEYFDTVTYVFYGEAKPERKPHGDAVLQAACKFPGLQELCVVHTDATDAGVENIGNLRRLKSLDFRINEDMTARAVKDFGLLTELRELRLASIPLEDKDLGFLRSLTKLERLSLAGRKFRVTGEWLENIRDLKTLQRLELYDMAITTQTLKPIEGLTNLWLLQLHNARIDSLDSLRPLTQLRILTLYGNPIDDDDLAVLKAMPGLYSLDLRKTKITDRGVAILATFPGLMDLQLDGTAITDAALIELAKFPKLRTVWLRDTKLSDEAIEAFRKAHPGILIRQ